MRDLIPLYSDNTASDESRKFIEEHCRTCDKCNRILSLSKTEIDKTAHLDDEINSVWKSIEKQNKKKRIIKVAIAAILVTVLIPLILSWQIICTVLTTQIQRKAHISATKC